MFTRALQCEIEFSLSFAEAIFQLFQWFGSIPQGRDAFSKFVGCPYARLVKRFGGSLSLGAAIILQICSTASTYFSAGSGMVALFSRLTRLNYLLLVNCLRRTSGNVSRSSIILCWCFTSFVYHHSFFLQDILIMLCSQNS